mmetsp:Transcript_19935/g.17033  ORF Transcript_19935/g.17033 Transcript_19935/m.17033 type:complete len:95 (+) Transcript_19935:1974-2258(+)
MAVYFMTFGREENHLLIYYQIVDNYQIRVNNDKQSVLIVWDLDSNTRITNDNDLKKIQWKKYNFPNSLHSKYIFYQNMLGNEEQKKEMKQKTDP